MLSEFTARGTEFVHRKHFSERSVSGRETAEGSPYGKNIGQEGTPRTIPFIMSGLGKRAARIAVAEILTLLEM